MEFAVCNLAVDGKDLPLWLDPQFLCMAIDLLNDYRTVWSNRLSRLPGLILGPQDQARRVRKDGPGEGIGRGSGEGPRGLQTLRFLLFLSPVRRLFCSGSTRSFAEQQFARTFIFF